MDWRIILIVAMVLVGALASITTGYRVRWSARMATGRRARRISNPD